MDYLTMEDIRAMQQGYQLIIGCWMVYVSLLLLDKAGRDGWVANAVEWCRETADTVGRFVKYTVLGPWSSRRGSARLGKGGER